MSKLGKKIKKHRQELGLTQQQFAEKIGISQVYLSQVETGVRLPSEDMVERIQAGLNVTQDQLTPKLTRKQKKNMRRILTEQELVYEYNMYHAILVKILDTEDDCYGEVFPAILLFNEDPNEEGKLVAVFRWRKHLYMKDYEKKWVAYHYFEDLIEEEREQYND